MHTWKEIELDWELTNTQEKTDKQVKLKGMA